MAHAIRNRSSRMDWNAAPLWALRALLVVWAGFWVWFNVASLVGERDGLGHHLMLGAITIGVGALGWFWPRVGGAVLVFAGLGAAAAFPNVWAFWLLAFPASVIGVGLMLVRRGR